MFFASSVRRLRYVFLIALLVPSLSNSAPICAEIFSPRALPSDLRNFVASPEDIARYRSRYEPARPKYQSDIWPKDWSEVQIGRGYPALIARQHMAYEEYRALNGYTKVGEEKQYAINKALWSQKPEKISQYADDIKLIASALTKLPGYLGLVVRLGSRRPEVIAQYQAGSIVTEKAFTSSSAEVNYALRNCEAGRAIFFIQSKGGGKLIEELSNVGHGEREVLFPPGTRFLVLKVETLDQFPGSPVIHLEEVN